MLIDPITLCFAIQSTAIRVGATTILAIAIYHLLRNGKQLFVMIAILCGAIGLLAYVLNQLSLWVSNQ